MRYSVNTGSLRLAKRKSKRISHKVKGLFEEQGLPLVEEGWIDEEASRLIARRYLQPMVENSVDALILGCTHYPLLDEMISRVVGNDVNLIDSGIEADGEVKRILDTHGLGRESSGQSGDSVRRPWSSALR